MTEVRKLVNPIPGSVPPLIEQIHAICAEALQEAGGFLVDHPEDNAFIVVFGGHEVAVTISNWDIRH
jgi:hypothetical protein